MKVSSSNIQDIAYDDKSQTLSVTFTSGGTYLYRDVPPMTYQDFLMAASKGQYFAQFIRNRYSATKAR